MDWQDEYRPDKTEGDNRPGTPEEMRQRNVRRTSPELDAPRRDRRQRPGGNKARRPGRGARPGQGSGPKEERQAETEPRRRKPAAAWRKTPGKPRKEKRQRKPASKAEVHWSEPKPFIRRVFFLKLAATVAVVLAVMLGFTIFFKVDKIAVSGTEKYTPEAVLAASGIQKGENLLTLGKAKRAGNILAALPYVKEVQIGIKLPDTVNINIVELEVTYAIADTEGRYWLMDSAGKLVEGISEAKAQEHTLVTGLVIQSPQVGKVIEPMDETPPQETVPGDTEETGETEATEPTEPQVTSPNGFNGSGTTKVQVVTEILKALEANNLMGEVETVDVTYLYNITLWYQDRFEVRLGEPEELTYKVNYMARAVQQLADYQIGVLDVTFENEREARFIPAET